MRLEHLFIKKILLHNACVDLFSFFLNMLFSLPSSPEIFSVGILFVCFFGGCFFFIFTKVYD